MRRGEAILPAKGIVSNGSARAPDFFLMSGRAAALELRAGCGCLWGFCGM